MAKIVLAIDIGGSKIRGGLITKKGEIKKKIEEKTPNKGNSGRVLTKKILEIAEKLYNPSIIGIGVGSAGLLNLKKGIISNPTNIFFDKVEVVKPLRKKFSKKVTLLNDGSAGLLGEIYFGENKNCKNAVYITISSGIGGGVMVNGKLLFGKEGNAGEIGHMIVETKYNLPCSCEQGKNHWEAYCSGINLPRFLRIFSGLKIKKTEDIFSEARKGSVKVLNFLEEVGKINGQGISNVIAAYDPEIIIIGGAVFLENKKFLLPYLKKNIDNLLTPPKIIPASLKENAPLLGAAAAVFNKNVI